MTSSPGLLLTLEGADDLQSPDWSAVEAALGALYPEDGCGFLILERDGRDYVQVSGGASGDGDAGYILEWREHSGDGFGHYAAAKSGTFPRRYALVTTSCSQTRVLTQERLGAEDVRALVRAFFDGKSRPDSYAWRDMTADFQ